MHRKNEDTADTDENTDTDKQQSVESMSMNSSCQMRPKLQRKLKFCKGVQVECPGLSETILLVNRLIKLLIFFQFQITTYLVEFHFYI